MADLAIFDLDYTITLRGTWGRFVSRSMRGRPMGLPKLWFAAGLTQWRYKRGDLPRIAVKTEMMRHSIAGWSRADLARLADEFVADDFKSGLNPRVVEALRSHQSAGDTVLIASAAIDLLVQRYAESLGVDGFVATTLQWTDEDHVAVGFDSANCYAGEKLRRIRSWIDREGIEPDRVTAYSDSRADAPMLEMADEAIIVQPNRKTRQYAESRGFQIW